jgi:hypothetical protein
MFGSSLPPVVCRRARVLSWFCVFLRLLMSNISLLLFFLVFWVVFFLLYQVVPVAWTNRIKLRVMLVNWTDSIWHRFFCQQLCNGYWSVNVTSSTLWRDRWKQLRVEGLHIQYHWYRSSVYRTRYDTNDDVCLDLQNGRSSIMLIHTYVVYAYEIQEQRDSITIIIII